MATGKKCSVASSDLNLLKCGVQAFQLRARVGGGEVPFGLGVVSISGRAPRVHLCSECGGVGNATVEALAGAYNQLGLSQIEPTAVLGRVVPFEPLDDPAGLGRLEGFIE